MNNKKGFTLIELMIVVAIIGILAAIAIPKFADLINKAKEGATKGALSSVRGALQVYYGDNEGVFPSDTLGVLTTSAKYINSIPIAKLPQTGHTDTAAIVAYDSSTAAGAWALAGGGANPDNTGGWAYFNNSSVNSSWGNFAVNCYHLQIKGDVPWSTF